MILIVAVLGLALGFLVNLLADSLPVLRRLSWPVCFACGAPRRPGAWISLAAWVWGAGRCPYCARGRRIREPMLEGFSGLWTVYLFLRDPRPQIFLPAVFLSTVFLLIVVIDLEHRLILHMVTIPSAILLGILGVFDPAKGPEKTLLGGLAGFVLVYFLYLLGGIFARALSKLRGREIDEVALGFGDVTLAGVIGLAVGWPGVLVALFLGIMAAGLFSVVYLLVMLVRRRYSAFMAIPYGPFLVLGAQVVYLGGRTALEGFLLP